MGKDNRFRCFYGVLKGEKQQGTEMRYSYTARIGALSAATPYALEIFSHQSHLISCRLAFCSCILTIRRWSIML